MDIEAKLAEEAAKLQAELKSSKEEKPDKEVKVDEVVEPTQEDKVVVSPEEEEATKLGWRPEAEYEGEGWVDAKEFLGRKPLFDAIQKANKKAKKVQEKMDLMVEEFNKQQQAGYDRAMADIAKAKEEAVELGDIQRYKELEKQEKEVAPVPIEPIVDKEYEEFLDANEWYDSDKVLTRFADGAATDIKNANPQISNKELFSKVVEEVKEAFPAKFSNPKKNKPSAVAVGTTTATSKEGKFKYTKHDLPEEVKKVYHELVTHGPLDEKQFLEGYASRGGTFIERGN